LILADILQILYAPSKAFKKIAENPKYIGAAIILLIFVVAQMGAFYSYFSTQRYETAFPAGADLGQYTQSAPLWTTSPSGVSVTSNNADFVNGSYYGNSSLQFAVSSSNNISLTLNANGTVDCSSTGFPEFSMRVKQVDPQVAPSSVTLYMYSSNSSDNYFSRDITSSFSNAPINVWNNLTIALNSSDWSSNGAAQLANITGLKLTLTYPASSNITLRLDGMFFRGIFQTVVEASGANFYIFFVQNNIMQFIIQWLLVTVIIFALIKGLKGTVTFKPLMVAVGCALILIVVQALIALAASTILPSVAVPIEAQASIAGETQTASILAFQSALTTFSYIYLAVQVAILAWMVGLGAFIVRTLTPFPWSKSILISAGAWVIAFFVLPYIYALLNVIVL
jgi:hypothetical protein